MTHETMIWAGLGLLAVTGVNMITQLFWEFWRSRAEGRKEQECEFVLRREHEMCMQNTRAALSQLRDNLKNFDESNNEAHHRIGTKVDLILRYVHQAQTRDL